MDPDNGHPKNFLLQGLVFPRGKKLIQLRPIFPQPHLGLAEDREHLVRLVPEGAGAVEVMEMAGFVDESKVAGGRPGHRLYSSSEKYSRIVK